MPTVASIRAGAHEIFYEGDGTGGGPSVVVLHGFRNSSQSWAPLRDRLDTTGLSAWYPDFPGCGSSSTPPTWKDCTIQAYAEVVERFCGALGLSDVVLVGHSLGGGVALQLALEQPGLLAGMVLVAPTPAEGLGYLTEAQVDSLINPTDDELETVARAAFHRPPPEADFERLMATVRSARPVHVEGAIRSQLEFQVAERLGEIAIPTLVVGGDRDRHIPVRYTLRTAASIRHCGVQIYHQVGHAPFFEAPDEFATLIRRFATTELLPGTRRRL